MSEELKNFLTQYISPQTEQEQREAARQSLLEYYQNPQSVLDLLTLYPLEQNRQVRFAAAVGLSKSLKNNWKHSLYGSEYHEPIKQSIIQILQFETDSINRHTLVRAIRPVMKKDSDNWPELYQLINVDKSDLTAVEFSMYLITYWVCYLPTNRRQEYLSFFLDLCQFSFLSENPTLIDTAFGLASQLINSWEDEEAEILQPIFIQMLDIYLVSLNQEDQNFKGKIANKLSHAFLFRDNYPLQMELIFGKLFEGVQIDPVLGFIPIQSLVNAYGPKILPIFPDIIQHTLAAANQVFVDDTLEANTDATFILETLEFIERVVKCKVFFPKLLELISTESPQDSVVSAFAISQVAEKSKEAIMKNIAFLSEFIRNLMQLENISAKDAALELIKDIVSSFPEGQKQTKVDEYVVPIFQLFTSGHPGIIKHGLLTLDKLFDYCDIDVNLIKPSIDALLQLLNTEGLESNFISLIVDVLSSLIFSAGEDIAPYVEELFPVVIQMASIEETDDSTIKSNAISALSNLLRFSAMPDEVTNQAIQLIIVSGNTQDYEIRATVMASLSNILTCHSPHMMNFAEPIQQLITAYMSEDIQENPDEEPQMKDDDDNDDDYDDDEDESPNFRNQNQNNSLTNMLLLVKNIYKLYPELGTGSPMDWFAYSVNLIGAYNDDLSVAAFLASTYMLLKIPTDLDPSIFFKKIDELYDDTGSITVANCFKAISRFIENDFELPPEIIQNSIEKAKLFLANKLECQNDFEEDDDSLLTLSMQANRFLSVIATKMPALFPLNEYIDYGSKLQKDDGEEFEISQFIGVLRQLYFNTQTEDPSHPKLSAIQSKMIVKIFLSNLGICDFTVIPEPLIAIRKLIEQKNEKVVQQLPQILEFVDSLFQNENQGEMHYWTTLTNAASLICTMIQIDPSSVDLQVWIPRILEILPVQGDEMEAEHIYNTLLLLISQPEIGAQIVSSLGGELIRVCAQTLGLHDKVLSSYNLQESTYQGIVSLLTTLLKSDGASAAFDQAFHDPLAKERCQTRLGQASA